MAGGGQSINIVKAHCLLLALVCSIVTAPAAVVGSFFVTNTNSSGPGSLERAILDANAHPSADRIEFSITSGGLTIWPTNALPEITKPVTLDATTQPGYAGVALVELSGSRAGTGVDGLRATAGPTIVRGLVITCFSAMALSCPAAAPATLPAT